MVNVAVATALSGIPVAYAIALIVVVLLTVTGPLYRVPVVSLGLVPLVVQRIKAPGVDVVMVTAWVAVYIPGGGLNAGVAATVMV
jgi:hypothetical protein